MKALVRNEPLIAREKSPMILKQVLVMEPVAALGKELILIEYLGLASKEWVDYEIDNYHKPQTKLVLSVETSMKEAKAIIAKAQANLKATQQQKEEHGIKSSKLVAEWTNKASQLKTE
ncbi:uncharacterized protein A4U43_C10F6630 [Asparagus officinalis]|uniref:Uncharacterized protein n=1 Tax=Asparagus officinalis TaxID=4686 RepID=A0A5P1E2Y0_ASPOF|nr:uncharacterized protein A4U43_C10F6630 [Asparagus officinalis]